MTKIALSGRIGDETIAEALRISERRLNKLGWNYSISDIGKYARLILESLCENDSRKTETQDDPKR